MPLTLVLASKAYSSWSLRPFIVLRQFAIPFDEIVIALGQETTRENILEYSPSARCPALIDGDLVIWDSVAIIEYIAETYPDRAIWPRDRTARAVARSLAAEMHAGFQGLRSHLPMNMRRAIQSRELTREAAVDVARLEGAWADARARFGGGGEFLFGDFSAVDAMFAPVANRLHVYDVPVSPGARAYMGALMALPAYRDWQRDAEAESLHIAKYEV